MGLIAFLFPPCDYHIIELMLSLHDLVVEVSSVLHPIPNPTDEDVTNISTRLGIKLIQLVVYFLKLDNDLRGTITGH